MKNVLFFSILFLIIIGCEIHTNPDTIPPTVTIINPQTGSVAIEIVIIECIASDNVGIDKVELWVDGESTNIIDETEPYSLYWNSTEYENGSYYILRVRAYDKSNNVTDSNAITLMVDNSGSYPTLVELYPIISQDGSFIITWSQNNDDDFSSYKLFESLYEDMSNNSLLFEIYNNADTSYIDITTDEIKYYQIAVEDSIGLQTFSNIQEANSYIRFMITFGGANYDNGQSVLQTIDDGFIIAANTQSFGNGDYDFWLIKTDSQGNEEWNQTFGGSGWDNAYSIQQTNNGGFIITGHTESFGSGDFDVWLIKTDSQGNEEWNQTFGGSYYDIGFSVQQTTDGGYVIAGCTDLLGTDYTDVWLIKTDSQGNEEWNQTFGESYSESGFSVRQTFDNGYIITGRKYSSSGPHYDVWLIKTDSNGNEEWNQIFGGNDYDDARSVMQTTDGSYIITGSTQTFSNGGYDVWLIKTDSYGNTVPLQ